MGYVSKNIDHLGIVAGVCKEIGLVEEVDKIVGVGDKQKVTTGEAVMGMVINGLGFVNRPLYLTPEFMKNKPIELFFRNASTLDGTTQFTPEQVKQEYLRAIPKQGI